MLKLGSIARESTVDHIQYLLRCSDRTCSKFIPFGSHFSKVNVMRSVHPQFTVRLRSFGQATSHQMINPSIFRRFLAQVIGRASSCGAVSSQNTCEVKMRVDLKSEKGVSFPYHHSCDREGRSSVENRIVKQARERRA